MSSKRFECFLNPDTVEYLDISTPTWLPDVEQPDEIDQIGLGEDADGVLIEPSTDFSEQLVDSEERHQPADLYHPGYLDAQGKFHPWF
ncbi:hypothetical protein IJI99_02785 [bacterium]|nr:hypothetical protein [bacterium]